MLQEMNAKNICETTGEAVRLFFASSIVEFKNYSLLKNSTSIV